MTDTTGRDTAGDTLSKDPLRLHGAGLRRLRRQYASAGLVVTAVIGLLATASPARADLGAANEAVTPVHLSGSLSQGLTLTWTTPTADVRGFNVFVNDHYFTTAGPTATSYSFSPQALAAHDTVQVEAADGGPSGGPRASISTDDLSAATTAAVTPTPTGPSAMLAPAGGIFGGAAFWRQSIRSAPVAGGSERMVADLANQVAVRYEGNAAFDDWDYAVGFYTVAADTPRVTIHYSDCRGLGFTADGLHNGAGQFNDVPVPADAVAAPGDDKNLTIYSPSTDQLWEFWVAEQTAGGWQACWGGRLDHASTSPGYFAGGFGALATGLSGAGGMVGVQEVRAGHIDHAIALTVVEATNWTTWSWPAQRSDGYDPAGNNSIPEGTRFRLDPAVDVDALPLHPIAKMIARAAQEYGFVVADKGGAVAVIGESGYPYFHATSVNPWSAPEAGTPSFQLLAHFPWNRLQAIPAGYGRP